MRKRAIWMIFFVCLIFGGSSVKVNGDMSNIEINQMFCINAYYSESEDKCIIFWDKIEDAKKYELYIRCGDEFIKVNESYNERSCLDLNQFEDMDIYDIRIIAYLNNKIQKSFVMSFEMFENNLIYVNHDTDNDGIEDGYEIMDLNTNPYSKDTDNDGYSDFYEVNISGTNPKSYNEEVSIDSGNFDYNNMKYDICVGGLNKDEVKIINQLTNKVKYIENCNGKYIYLYDENNNLLRVSFKNPNGETYHTFYTYENNNLKSIRKNNNLYEFNYTKNNDIEEIKVNGSIISQNNYTKNSESLISEKKYGNGQTISYDYYDNGLIKDCYVDGKLYYNWEYIGDEISQINDIRNTNKSKIYHLDDWTFKTDSNGNSTKYKVGEDSASIYYSIGDKKLEYKIDLDYENEFTKVSLSNGITINREIKNGNEYSNILFNEKNIIKEAYLRNTDGTAQYSVNGKQYKYIYDSRNYITKVLLDGKCVNTYEYSDDGKVIKEMFEDGRSVSYKYQAGNIISVNIYSKDNKLVNSDNYTYENETEQLSTFNGKKISYDEIGNPVRYYNGMKFKWELGNQLVQVKNKNKNIKYSYNSEGIRISKSVNGVKTEYYVNSNKIIGEKRLGEQIIYMYNSVDCLVGFIYRDKIFYYEKNLQKDIVGILDSNGKIIAEYDYDSWGNIIQITGNRKIATLNPYRYRSYYYDEETGFYYLNSRYYDSKLRKFINMDTEIVVDNLIDSNSLFSYCDNNPINYIDNLGNAKSITTPKYNSLYYWNKTVHKQYNCYGFAIGKTDKYINPGFYSVPRRDITYSPIQSRYILLNVKEDLKTLGYAAISSSDTPVLKDYETLITFRNDEGIDYHFMRRVYGVSGFYHKPGQTAVLKYLKSPSSGYWYSEYYADGWYEGDCCYDTGQYFLIIYKN